MNNALKAVPSDIVVDAQDKSEPKRDIPFRIQFHTSVVKPADFPGFPFVASKVSFDGILMTAIVYGATADDAVSRITSSWPKCEVRYIEQGAFEFRSTDTMQSAAIFGSVTAAPRGFIRRWLNR